MIPLFYDMFAFVPQALIGYFCDKHKKTPILLLILGFIFFHGINMNSYIAIFVLAIENACLHIDGAESTLRFSKGNMSPAAIFVAGGSFGVVCGKLLASSSLSYLFLVFLPSLLFLVLF